MIVAHWITLVIVPKMMLKDVKEDLKQPLHSGPKYEIIVYVYIGEIAQLQRFVLKVGRRFYEPY